MHYFRQICIRFYSSVNEILRRKGINGESVQVSGWIKAIRTYKLFNFVDINDGTCYENLQMVVAKNIINSKLNVGSSIIAEGVIRIQEKNGQMELVTNKIRIIGDNQLDNGYPFLPRKTYSYEYIRQYLETRSRTSKLSTIFRIRSSATKFIHDFFAKEEFKQVHTPILTGNDCEGAGEIFLVQPKNQKLINNMRRLKEQNESEIFFNHDTYLTVSSQLHLESMAHSFQKVYNFGPIFRAENSKSRFHLSEFYMIEAEQSFVFDYEPILKLIEKLIKTLTKNLLDLYQNEIETVLFKDSPIKSLNKITPLIEKDFIHLKYLDAVHELEKKFPNVSRFSNFTKEQEIFLVENYGQIPIFITDWSKKTKPFYMKECDHSNEFVKAFDLLIPTVGELVGGGVRENDFDRLQNNMKNLNIHNLDWYLNLRKFGSVPTAGFGLGFERYLQFLLHLENIKDTIPFPRSPHNCLL